MKTTPNPSLRTRMPSTTTRLVLTVALALAAPLAALAQTQIAEVRAYPLVIDQPGHYQLTTGLNPPAQTAAVRITAANVVLDLNGQTVKGTPACALPCMGNSVGIVIAGSNVKVRNGTVTGFDQAGVTFGNQYVELEDLRVTGNTVHGVHRTSPPAAVWLQGVHAVLRRVTAIKNGTGLNGYAMVVDAAVVQQNGVGILSHGASTIRDTLIAQSTTYGLVSASPQSDVLRDSRLHQNATQTVGVATFAGTNVLNEQVFTR